MKIISMIFCLLLLGQEAPVQEETKLNVRVHYNRYIVGDSNCYVSHRDLNNTPIVPSKYREKYSEDTIYIMIGDVLYQDTLHIYNGDDLVYSDVLTSDPAIPVSAGFKVAKKECRSLWRIQLNSHNPVDIGIDRTLHFLYIGYEPKDNTLNVTMTNKVLLFR